MFYIRTWEDEVLRKESWLVTDETFPQSSAWSIIDEMAWMMINQGLEYLTAPQIGVSRQIVMYERDGKFEVLINPVLRQRSSSLNYSKEKCPSIPGVSCDVPRWNWIVVDAEDYYGREVSIQADGRTARVIQHALDHLNGRLISDFEK